MTIKESIHRKHMFSRLIKKISENDMNFTAEEKEMILLACKRSFAIETLNIKKEKDEKLN